MTLYGDILVAKLALLVLQLVANTCQFVRPNNQRCSRRVNSANPLCWQHAHGAKAKWKALTRNQTVVFVLALLSLAATVWFGLHQSSNATKTIQSLGDKSPNIVDNQGKVEVNDQDSPSQSKKPTKRPKP